MVSKAARYIGHSFAQALVGAVLMTVTINVADVLSAKYWGKR